MDDEKIPNLFVLGAPKCGTTSIVHYLEQHPNVLVSPTKEPHFFNTDSEHRYVYTTTDYLSLFQNATPEHKYRCEGSVWYLYSKVAAEEIMKFNPNAKFIVMLRNPVSMFFSLHQELLFGGSEDNSSAVQAWRLQEQRAHGKNLPRGCSDPALLQYGLACSLGEQVKRLLKTVPRSRVHFILLDEIRNDPETAYLELQRFLGLTEYRLPAYRVVNKRKVRRSQMLARLFIRITELKRRLGISRGFGIATAINRRNVSHAAVLDTLHYEDLTIELQDYFDADIRVLEAQTQKNLSAWKRPDE